MKTASLLVMLLFSWCDTDAKAPAVAPVATPPRAAAAACTPLTGPATQDVAVIVACDGCRQFYFSSQGLPPGYTFDACMTQRTASVRAKLAADPHCYDDILPQLRGRE